MIIPLASGAVHVWCADLGLPDDIFYSVITSLNTEEVARGHRLISAYHQRLFFSAHAILRNILSHYLDCSPKDLCFEKGAHGKPYLLKPMSLPLQFNMTHSANLALYAICLEHDIGIDVECIDRHTEIEALANRFFAKSEYEQLISFPPSERQRAFFRAWTRKEAFIKALGKGLSYPLKDFVVDLAQHCQQGLLSIEGNEQRASQWTLQSITVNESTEAAYALPSPFCSLSIKQWRFQGE